MFYRFSGVSACFPTLVLQVFENYIATYFEILLRLVESADILRTYSHW